jgi:hypothetical protein
MIKKIIISGLIGLSAVSFVACSDDGGGGGTEIAKEGVFLDSAVEGLSYSTPTESGITGKDGSFKYKTVEKVEFKIGSIILGSSSGQSKMSPLDLMHTAIMDDKVVNMLRFLQSIDSDHNASNGITISQAFKDKANSRPFDFNNDIDYDSLFTTLDIKEEYIVSEAKARNHFKTALDEINKPANADEFKIIKGIYQKGRQILNITSSGVINHYYLHHINNCIVIQNNYDALDEKILKHDAKNKRFFITDGYHDDLGWKYQNNKISEVFFVDHINDSLGIKSLPIAKSTKFPTPADIENNMCYAIGETKKYENIQGVYQYVKFNEDTNDSYEKKIRNAVIHINKDGKIKSYTQDSDRNCLNATVSGEYNFILNDKNLSETYYSGQNADAQYYYVDSDGNKFVWLEDENSKISMVGYKGKDKQHIKEFKLMALSIDEVAITPFKSIKYTEANIASKMCN